MDPAIPITCACPCAARVLELERKVNILARRILDGEVLSEAMADEIEAQHEQAATKARRREGR